jgi:hypothetical protein
MKWVVDTPVRIGPRAFAAIAETAISAHSAGSVVAGFGSKRPLLFLQSLDGEVTAVDIDGHRYVAEEIERRYPSAITRLNSVLRETE